MSEVIPTVEHNQRLMRLSDLAKFMGVPKTLLYDAKSAGMPCPAGRSCQSWVMEWLRDNPTFMPSDFRKTKSVVHSQDEQRRGQTDGCKRHERSPKHVQRKPSSVVLNARPLLAAS